MPITLPNLAPVAPSSSLPQFDATVQGGTPLAANSGPTMQNLQGNAQTQPAPVAYAANPTQQSGPFGPKSSTSGAAKLWDTTNLPSTAAASSTASSSDSGSSTAKPASTASSTPTPGQIAVANALAPYSSGSSGYGVGMMGQPDGGSAQWLANTNANRAAQGALTTAQGVPYDPSTITATGPGAQARLQAHIDSLNAASPASSLGAAPAQSAAAAAPAASAASPAASPAAAAAAPRNPYQAPAAAVDPWTAATNANRAKLGLPPLPSNTATASRGQSAATMGAPGAV